MNTKVQRVLSVAAWFSCSVFLIAFAPAVTSFAAESYHVSYELKKPGTVSVSVYDAEGRIIKELLVGKRQEAGKQETSWDGTDQDGKPVAPGRYTWKGIAADLGVRYHMTVGNSGNPPYKQTTARAAGAAGTPARRPATATTGTCCSDSRRAKVC